MSTESGVKRKDTVFTRGVDKFVRVGGLGCYCVYMQIFSPQSTMYSNIIRWDEPQKLGGLQPP